MLGTTSKTPLTQAFLEAVSPLLVEASVLQIAARLDSGSLCYSTEFLGGAAISPKAVLLWRHDDGHYSPLLGLMSTATPFSSALRNRWSGGVVLYTDAQWTRLLSGISGYWVTYLFPLPFAAELYAFVAKVLVVWCCSADVL